MSELTTFLQPASVIIVLGGMLKFLVVDKLKTIQDALQRLEDGHAEHTAGIHELEIRMTRLETEHVNRCNGHNGGA